MPEASTVSLAGFSAPRIELVKAVTVISRFRERAHRARGLRRAGERRP
jgi:hypothetical protein